MTNAWELLLKAKWLVDHGDQAESIYEMTKDSVGNEKPKENRSGNPISIGLTYLAAKLSSDKNSGLDKPSYENILALVEIRDNAAHLVNNDPYIARRVLEIGTASLRNYLLLAADWFKLDLAKYNFFLMPISFFHGFESAEPATRINYPTQIQKLLAYLDAREASEAEESSTQHVALRLETRFVRAKDTAAIEFRYTNNPFAPELVIREEDVLRNYPMTHAKLIKALRDRYQDFKQSSEFNQLKRRGEAEKTFCLVRSIDPTNPRCTKQKFYSLNIFQEFDKYYTRAEK